MCDRYPALLPDVLLRADAPEPAPELRLLHEHHLPEVPAGAQPAPQSTEVRPHSAHTARHAAPILLFIKDQILILLNI
jgi:hypothetical protein